MRHGIGPMVGVLPRTWTFDTLPPDLYLGYPTPLTWIPTEPEIPQDPGDLTPNEL